MPNVTSTVAPNATSVATKQPVYASPSGQLTPVTQPVSKPAGILGNVQGSSGTYQADPLLAKINSAQALTPQEISAKQSQANSAASNPLPSYSPGTVGIGSPAAIASNQTPSGLLGNLVGLTTNNYQQQQSALMPSVQANQGIINDATRQEMQLTGGSYSGTAADYSGRIAQLENLKQAAQGNVNAALGNVNAAVNPAVSGLTSGLSAATQYQQAPYGTPLYNPLTGQYTTPSGGVGGATGLTYNPSTDATSLAKQVIGGQMTYDQALSSLGYAGNIATGLLTQAINAQGGNALQLQAQGSGQQSVLQNIPQLQSANTAAKGIEQTITQFLGQHPEINSSPLSVANAAQQWLQGKQLTDPNYQLFFNYLSEYANTLAPILGVGGDPTNLKTQIAQGFLNAQASGASIQQVLQGIGQLAEQKVQNLQSGATGGGVVASGSGGTGSSVTAGGYTFVQDANGNWIPKS